MQRRSTVNAVVSTTAFQLAANAPQADAHSSLYIRHYIRHYIRQYENDTRGTRNFGVKTRHQSPLVEISFSGKASQTPSWTASRASHDLHSNFERHVNSLNL